MAKGKIIKNIIKAAGGKTSKKPKKAVGEALKRKVQRSQRIQAGEKAKRVEKIKGQVEALQKKIREAAKKEGLTVKQYRQLNKKKAAVKKLHELKPNIKSADELRRTNRQVTARRRARDTASKRAGTFTGFERDPKAPFTKRELDILRKQYERAGGKTGTGQTFTEFKRQYKGKYFDG
jgi:hypothetical protein